MQIYQGRRSREMRRARHCQGRAADGTCMWAGSVSNAPADPVSLRTAEVPKVWLGVRANFVGRHGSGDSGLVGEPLPDLLPAIAGV